jgi:hypothetical protein
MVTVMSFQADEACVAFDVAVKYRYDYGAMYAALRIDRRR